MAEKSTIQSELEIIRRQGKGILCPEQVVAFAEDPQTALHHRFEWNDKEASTQYRLEQARRLIRVYVTVLPQENQPTRCYVSLLEDRKTTGGYRSLSDILSNEEQRQMLFEQAQKEFRDFTENFRQKYSSLPGIGEIIRVMKDTKWRRPRRKK